MSNEHNEFDERKDIPEKRDGSDNGLDNERGRMALISREMIRIAELKGESRYRNELAEALSEVVSRARFKESLNDELYNDKEELERRCGINFDKEYLYHKEVFISFWEGRYKRNDARFELMIQLVEEDKKNKSVCIQERRSDWVAQYIEGCDIGKNEIQMPLDQNPDEVLAAFHDDCAFVETLPLLRGEKQEAVRHLCFMFLEGEYPIVIDRKDPASRDVMRRKATEIATMSYDDMGIRAVAISVAMQRYRLHVSQGLDHETEEIKRKEESRPVEEMNRQKFESMRQQYRAEMDFIDSLALPDFEAEEYPQFLERIASIQHLKTDPEAREIAHQDIRDLISHLPKRNEYYGDPWAVVTHLLHDYWLGRYKPDALRRIVLRNILRDLPSGYSQSPTGKPINQFYLREKFIKGSSAKNATINALQDEIVAGRAYQRDIQLINDLKIDNDIIKRAAWEYNKYLLEGDLPIAADREVPEDRLMLEKKLQECAQREYVHEIDILQQFCDHWYSIAKRSLK